MAVARSPQPEKIPVLDYGAQPEASNLVLSRSIGIQKEKLKKSLEAQNVLGLIIR
jgi:hypothetical protein